MIEREITIKIRVDEENISKLYNNYDINFDSVEDFMMMLIRDMETDTEFDGFPVDSMEQYGFDVVCTTD
mgnify:CR=1 FL=1|tara:strand:- start:229 stop:435 length:207 start_codon:yes stop_codon:yes gene_type:complete